MSRSMLDRLRTALRRLMRRGIGSRDHQELLRVCAGDEGAAERLVGLERARNPGISETEAHRRAIRRHARDNR